MIYRIVSDISTFEEFRENAFCIKVVNGTVLTYVGRFKEYIQSCSVCEIMASAIGLGILEPILKRGDTVFVHSDVTISRHAKSTDYPLLRNRAKRLRQRGVTIFFEDVRGEVKGLYLQCHRTARGRMRVRHQRYMTDHYNNQHLESVIWKHEQTHKAT